jgi:quercetin dioxygenase-like cupin family protein
MNVTELHPGENPVSAISIFQCRDGGITSLQILPNQFTEIQFPEIPSIIICLTGKVMVTNDAGAMQMMIPGDFFKLAAGVNHSVSAMLHSNLLLIR